MGEQRRTPRSGEECLIDGEFKRIADLRHPEGDTVEPDWRQVLIQVFATAVQGGKEQVVMVFSRQGCGWCDRFIPVLQRSIVSHKKAIADDNTSAAVLEIMPLRVFVFDAAEFRELMQQFPVEGFPTSIVFGKQPGVVKFVAGYKGDEDLEQLLRTVALAKPEPPADKKPKEKGRRILR